MQKKRTPLPPSQTSQWPTPEPQDAHPPTVQAPSPRFWEQRGNVLEGSVGKGWGVWGSWARQWVGAGESSRPDQGCPGPFPGLGSGVSRKGSPSLWSPQVPPEGPEPGWNLVSDNLVWKELLLDRKTQQAVCCLNVLSFKLDLLLNCGMSSKESLTLS